MRGLPDVLCNSGREGIRVVVRLLLPRGDGSGTRETIVDGEGDQAEIAKREVNHEVDLALWSAPPGT